MLTFLVATALTLLLISSILVYNGAFHVALVEVFIDGPAKKGLSFGSGVFDALTGGGTGIIRFLYYNVPALGVIALIVYLLRSRGRLVPGETVLAFLQVVFIGSIVQEIARWLKGGAFDPYSYGNPLIYDVPRDPADSSSTTVPTGT